MASRAGSFKATQLSSYSLKHPSWPSELLRKEFNYSELPGWEEAKLRGETTHRGSSSQP